MARKPQGGGTGATGARGAQDVAFVDPNTPNDAMGSPGSGSTSSYSPTVIGPNEQINGVAIPSKILTALGLKNTQVPTMLVFKAGGVQHAPATGEQLWHAIQQLTSAYAGSQYKQANLLKLQNYLKQLYFPQNFNPNGRDKQKVFTAVTNLLTDNSYALTGLRKPTNVEIYGASGASTIATLKQQNKQLTVSLNNATAAQEQSAFGVVQNYLENWGMGSVQNAKDIWSLISKDGEHITNTDEILNVIRGTGSTDPVYKRLQDSYAQAFPGLREYNNQPGAVRMTEGAYQQYTQAVVDASAQFGAPIPNQKVIGDLLKGNVSAVEYKQRVQDIYSAIQNSDQNVRNILEQQHGIGQDDLFHYMTTGSMPARQRTVAAAQMQDYASRVGLQGLSQANFRQLGEMARIGAGANPLGYGTAQIQQALLSASRDAALTQSTPGQAAQTVSTQQLVGSQLAGFAGTNQPAEQVQVARAEQQKAAPFEKGGGFVESQKGVTGLGSART